MLIKIFTVIAISLGGVTVLALSWALVEKSLGWGPHQDEAMDSRMEQPEPAGRPKNTGDSPRDEFNRFSEASMQNSPEGRVAVLTAN